MTDSNTRCGFIALVGPTNAGKSTLLNQLLGCKAAAVSRKVNTTRHRIRGIVVRDKTQMVLIDTPGFSNHKKNAAPQNIAPEEAANADATVLLLDARHLLDDDLAQQVLDTFVQHRPKGLCVALNKIDTMRRTDLLQATQWVVDKINPEQVFLISALTGDGTDKMLNYWVEKMPHSPWLYAANQLTDLPLKLTAAEMTREHIYDRLHDELPYIITPITESVLHKRDGSVLLHQTLYVPDERYKPLVIGRGGQMLRLLGERSRESLSQHLGKTVHLMLHVKVRARAPLDESLIDA